VCLKVRSIPPIVSLRIAANRLATCWLAQDIDLLIVGNPDPDSLFDLTGEAGRILRREVNAQRVSQEAWLDPGDDVFLRAVKDRPLVKLNLDREAL
jgi:hypothetical protein